MAATTDDERYAAYVGWCQSIGIVPAEFREWQYQLRKIPEVTFQHE